MPLGAQLPVRLDPEVEAALERIAVQNETTKSALIRLLAKTFVDQVVDDSGRVTLPPDWKRQLQKADRRSPHQREPHDDPRTRRPRRILDRKGNPPSSEVINAAASSSASARAAAGIPSSPSPSHGAGAPTSHKHGPTPHTGEHSKSRRDSPAPAPKKSSS